MSTADAMKEIRVDWATYHRMIERLIVLVNQSGWQFDQILCLARGGLRIGDVFSRIFNLPLAVLATSSYRENEGHTQGALEIAPFISMTQGTLKGRVLVVDDLVDSGSTLQGVCRHLLRTYPSIEAVKTAVIWYKSSSSVEPDFFVEKLKTNPWIHQPFEIYDGMSPLDLLEKSTLDHLK